MLMYKPSELMTIAKRKLVNGWTKGEYCYREGGKTEYCAMGAINAVGKKHGGTKVMALKLAKAIIGADIRAKPSLDDLDYVITTWNDTSSRTKAQVLKAFDKASGIRV
jgi:hypothetical protein